MGSWAFIEIKVIREGLPARRVPVSVVFLFFNDRSWNAPRRPTFQDDDKGQQQIVKYSIKNPGQVINSAGVFYIFPNLFYDLFSGLDSRELFVQVAPACRDKKNPRVAFACRGLFILRYKLILRLFQRAGWPRVVCTSRVSKHTRIQRV